MYHKGDKYPTNDAYEYVINELKRRHVTVEDIANITYELQHKYNPSLVIDDYANAIDKILHRHDVLSNAMVAFELDNAAENHKLAEPLQTIIERDESLFGVDELLAIGITNLYGTIGITNFGYVDKLKKGVIKRLDEDARYVNTFADDIVGAVAVAAGAKLAHAENE